MHLTAATYQLSKANQKLGSIECSRHIEGASCNTEFAIDPDRCE
jgi:hypothetical protein